MPAGAGLEWDLLVLIMDKQCLGSLEHPLGRHQAEPESGPVQAGPTKGALSALGQASSKAGEFVQRVLFLHLNRIQREIGLE